MFSIRKNIGTGLHWSRPFLSQLGADLTEAGFDELKVKLPVNLAVIVKDSIPVQERIDAELRDREITFQEFLDRERNYPAIIMVAINSERRETLKILFVNTSKKTAFMDDTFPSGHSVPSQLYVQSPDPARVYSLFHFFYEFLRKHSESTTFEAVLGLIAMLITGAEIVFLLGSGRGLLQSTWGWHFGFDIAAFILLIIIQYNAFRTPTGLSVNERETQTAGSLFIRAIRGELRDNPIVNIVVGLIASLLSAIILRLIGWP